MKKQILHLSAWAVAASLCAMPVLAEDDFEIDSFDFDDDSFDDVDFDAVEFDEETESHWYDDVNLELSHDLVSSKNTDWQFTTNVSTATTGWSGSITPQVYVELEGRAEIYWGDDTRRDDEGSDERWNAFLNTAFAQTSVGDMSLKAGFFTIGWGEVEGSGTLDVINPTGSITSGAMDIAGSAQTFVSADYYLGKATLSGFVNFLPEVADIPGVIAAEVDSFEYGAKATLNLTGSDVSLYAGQLVPNSPVFNLTNGSAIANDFWLLGLSANRSLGKTLVKLDVAYKHRLETSDTASASGLSAFNRLDYALGAEIGFSEGRQLVASVSNKQILEFVDSYQMAPGFAAKEHSAQAMLSYSDTFLNDDLSLTLGGLGSLDGELGMVFSQVEYTLNDQWMVSSGLTTAIADEDSLFAAFDEEVLFSAGVSWQK
jgi:hypothetical protein